MTLNLLFLNFILTLFQQVPSPKSPFRLSQFESSFSPPGLLLKILAMALDE
jgi:hypothetical protein